MTEETKTHDGYARIDFLLRLYAEEPIELIERLIKSAHKDGFDDGKVVINAINSQIATLRRTISQTRKLAAENCERLLKEESEESWNRVKAEMVAAETFGVEDDGGNG